MIKMSSSASFSKNIIKRRSLINNSRRLYKIKKVNMN